MSFLSIQANMLYAFLLFPVCATYSTQPTFVWWLTNFDLSSLSLLLWSIMPSGQVMSKVLNKDRNSGPPGWGLAVRLRSNLVKTQMSGNLGSEKPWPEKWPGGGGEKRIIIGRFFFSIIQNEANEYAIIWRLRSISCVSIWLLSTRLIFSYSQTPSYTPLRTFRKNWSCFSF